MPVASIATRVASFYPLMTKANEGGGGHRRPDKGFLALSHFTPCLFAFFISCVSALETHQVHSRYFLRGKNYFAHIFCSILSTASLPNPLHSPRRAQPRHFDLTTPSRPKQQLPWLGLGQKYRCGLTPLRYKNCEGHHDRTTLPPSTTVARSRGATRCSSTVLIKSKNSSPLPGCTWYTPQCERAVLLQ